MVKSKHEKEGEGRGWGQRGGGGEGVKGKGEGRKGREGRKKRGGGGGRGERGGEPASLKNVLNKVINQCVIHLWFSNEYINTCLKYFFVLIANSANTNRYECQEKRSLESSVITFFIRKKGS